MTTANQFIFRKRNLELRMFKGNSDPETLQKIGEARAKAFKSYLPVDTHVDLDEYDNDYLHLYLVDRETNEIAGAFRIGNGSSIYKQKGYSGLYMNKLFELEKLGHLSSKSLELGRAFVSDRYRGSFYPLLMLFNGYYQYFADNKELDYCTSSITLPNTFKKESIEMILDYLFINHVKSLGLVNGKQKQIRPKLKWKFKSLKELTNALHHNGDYLPVMLKLSLDQNFEVLGFNMDSDFGNSIDIFGLTRKKMVSKKTISYLKMAS